MATTQSTPKPAPAPPPPTPASTVVVPMALQALVVSEDFKDSKMQLSPLVQPNLALLRPKEGAISSDLIAQLDISSERLKASLNTRFVDVVTGQVRNDRVGVYLSWCLPRVYRTGITATTSAAQSDGYDDARVRSGYSLETHDGSDVQVS